MKIKIDEWLFYVPWVILITNTLIAQSYLNCYSSQFFTIIGILGLLVKAFYRMCFKLRELILMGILLLLGTAIALSSTDNRMLWLAIALCASINTDFYKTTRLTYWVMLIETVAIVSSCVLFYGNIGTSMKGGLALGLGHPNILHGMVFLLCAMYLYLNWNYISIFKIAVIELTNFAIYKITLSRTGLLTITAMLLMILLYMFFPSKKVMKFIVASVFIIVLAFTIAPLIYEQYPDNNILLRVDDIMTGRLWQSRWYYRISGIKLFGNYYAELYASDPYALLDMGVFRLLIEYGLIAYVLIMWGYFRIIMDAIKRNDIGLSFMCLAMLVFSCTESLGTYVFFNVTFLGFDTLIFRSNQEKRMRIYKKTASKITRSKPHILIGYKIRK